MYWNILISLYLKDWTCCVAALQQLVLPPLLHFMSHFEHWPEKSRCLFQSRAAADSLALQPCTLNHSNLVCFLDGGELVSCHDACVTFTVFIWQFLTVCTMEKSKGELKTSTAAVPTCGVSSLLSVIEQWQRWCFSGLGGEKLYPDDWFRFLFVSLGWGTGDSAPCIFTCPRNQVKQTFPGSQPGPSFVPQADLSWWVLEIVLNKLTWLIWQVMHFLAHF